MVKSLHNVLLLSISLLFTGILSAQKFGFNEVLLHQPNRITTFCVPNNEQNEKALIGNSINVKFETAEYLFISTTPNWVNNALNSGEITDFYFEYAPPTLLNDTTRATHFVNEVHTGTGGLESLYTGKNVIYGFIDTGLELYHPDFLDANGNTRVLRYWDQTMPDDANSPTPYGYGFVWDSTSINNMTITSTDDGGHGTQVAGVGTGNGLANGTNKGMAPDANIIIVQSDLYRSNWTLTVADAVDYIFKVADTLNMPAVVNISLGSYLGSHDGNDPASVLIEELLDEKSGRIVISAAGNSGAFTPFHVHNEITSDTSFILQIVNPSSVLGPNTIYFDLWTEMSEATWDYSIAVDRPATDWSEAGTTIFRGAIDNIGTPIFETIRNENNDILAIASIYTEQIGDSYRMQLLIEDADSLPWPPYLYRFNTVGSGSYDLWSGTDIGYNLILGDTLGASTYPNINRIILPDMNQSIVSSWNCSEKVVSVGNFRNRWSYIDMNGNSYSNSDPTVAGQLSHNSSKGPNRHNVIKPDILAAGDVTLTAGPLPFLNNTANNPGIDSGGWHTRGGGTSLSAPVVGGIGALYLERCSQATYQDFLTDIKATAFQDGFTGTIPNNADGYGKIHALNTLLEQTLPAPPIVTLNWAAENLFSSEVAGNQWFLDDVLLVGETNETLIPSTPFGSYQVLYTNNDGCSTLSSPLLVTVGLESLKNENFQVSPNPTNSVIQLEYAYNIDAIHLFDLTGKKHIIKEISNNSYSLEGLPNGNYILEITSTEGKFTSKIIKL